VNSKDNRKAIRVVIAEDQGMVLGALAALLEIEGDMAVVGRARTGKEALNTVLRKSRMCSSLISKCRR